MNPVYRKRYAIEKPWYRVYDAVTSRVYGKKQPYRKLGITCTMTATDFKTLWFRDHANQMQHPSIDRIDTTQGYSFSNCRFIELDQNKSRQKRRSEWMKNQYRGVGWSKYHKKWTARINYDNQQKFLGYFQSSILAAKAFNRVAKKLYGKEALLNVI